MQRIFGAMAIFLGWLSLGLGVMAGLVESQFFGLNHREDALPPMDVYGITGAVVLWIFVGAAVLLAVPMAAAMVAPDPRRNLRILAVGMAVTGLALVPDQLGRFFGLPIVIGALAVWVGAELIHMQTPAASAGGGGVATPWSTPAIYEVPPHPAAPYVAAEPGVPDGPAATWSEPTPAPPATSAPPATPAARPPTAAPTPTPQAETRGSRRKAAGPERLCPWCSSAVPAKATSCPNCQAILDTESGDAITVSGVTEISPELQKYAEKVRAGKSRTSLLSMIFSDPPVAPVINAPEPSDADALRPPSAALKAEMARLDAEIAAEAAVRADAAGPADPSDPAEAPADGGPDASNAGPAPDGPPDHDATKD